MGDFDYDCYENLEERALERLRDKDAMSDEETDCEVQVTAHLLYINICKTASDVDPEFDGNGQSPGCLVLQRDISSRPKRKEDQDPNGVSGGSVW